MMILILLVAYDYPELLGWDCIWHGLGVIGSMTLLE